MGRSGHNVVMDGGVVTVLEDGAPAFSAVSFARSVRTKMGQLDEHGHTVGPSRTEFRQFAERFGEGVPDVATAWVLGIYSVALNRLPDAAGLIHHVGAIRSGTAATTVLAAIENSPECLQLRRTAPVDPDLAFAVGLCALVFGGRPGGDALDAVVGDRRRGASEELCLWLLLRRGEGTSSAFLLGEFEPREVSTAIVLQTRVLRRAPVSRLTQHLAYAIEPGEVLRVSRGGLDRTVVSVRDVVRIAWAARRRRREIETASALRFLAQRSALEMRLSQHRVSDIGSPGRPER